MSQDIDDKDIDTSEVPELDESFFEGATLTRPGEDLLQEASNMADYLELNTPEDVAEMDGHPVEQPQIPVEVSDYVEKAFSPMEDGGVPVVPAEEKPFPTPMEAAAAAGLQAAHAAVQPFGLGVMVIVYSTDGGFRSAYSSELNGTAAVGFLQRAAFSVHSALK